MYQKLLITAAAAAVILSGCRTIPQNPAQLTCEDLDDIAEEQVKAGEIPFLATQMKYPGDWRPYAPNRWILEGSRKQIRIRKVDYLQMEILTIGSTPTDQTPYRVRLPVSACRNAAKKTDGTLEKINLLQDSPEKFSQKVSFSFMGQNPEDYLARLVCGFQKLPDLDRDQTLAQKWQACQNPAKKP